jgi:transposase
MILTDEQWQLLQPLFSSRQGPGRPPADPRLILDAYLWRQLNSRPWRALPAEYPAFQVCHRTTQKWLKSGLLRLVLQQLDNDLRTRGHLDLRTCFADAALITYTLPDGVKVILPAPQFKDQWQYITAMLFIAPAWHALHTSFRGSGPLERMRSWQSMTVDQFQSEITSFLERLLNLLHRETPGTSVEP